MGESPGREQGGCGRWTRDAPALLECGRFRRACRRTRDDPDGGIGSGGAQKGWESCEQGGGNWVDRREQGTKTKGTPVRRPVAVVAAAANGAKAHDAVPEQCNGGTPLPRGICSGKGRVQDNHTDGTECKPKDGLWSMGPQHACLLTIRPRHLAKKSSVLSNTYIVLVLEVGYNRGKRVPIDILTTSPLTLHSVLYTLPECGAATNGSQTINNACNQIYIL